MRLPSFPGLRRLGKRHLVAGAIAVAALAAAPAIATASIPNSGTGMINACYTTSGGALRVVDAQAGQTCRTSEQSLSWPASGAAATQYGGGATDLSHDAGQFTNVLTGGPVLPPGTWNVSATVILLNGTGQGDTFRCGPLTDAGVPVSGSAVGIAGPSYGTVTVPALFTLTSADRINIRCLHDSPLPAGTVQAVFTNVVAEQVASRF